MPPNPIWQKCSALKACPCHLAAQRWLKHCHLPLPSSNAGAMLQHLAPAGLSSPGQASGAAVCRAARLPFGVQVFCWARSRRRQPRPSPTRCGPCTMCCQPTVCRRHTGMQQQPWTWLRTRLKVGSCPLQPCDSTSEMWTQPELCKANGSSSGCHNDAPGLASPWNPPELRQRPSGTHRSGPGCPAAELASATNADQQASVL